jgi:hypothetical protein
MRNVLLLSLGIIITGALIAGVIVGQSSAPRSEDSVAQAQEEQEETGEDGSPEEIVNKLAPEVEEKAKEFTRTRLEEEGVSKPVRDDIVQNLDGKVEQTVRDNALQQEEESLGKSTYDKVESVLQEEAKDVVVEEIEQSGLDQTTTQNVQEGVSQDLENANVSEVVLEDSEEQSRTQIQDAVTQTLKEEGVTDEQVLANVEQAVAEDLQDLNVSEEALAELEQNTSQGLGDLNIAKLGEENITKLVAGETDIQSLVLQELQGGLTQSQLQEAVDGELQRVIQGNLTQTVADALAESGVAQETIDRIKEKGLEALALNQAQEIASGALSNFGAQSLITESLGDLLNEAFAGLITERGISPGDFGVPTELKPSFGGEFQFGSACTCNLFEYGATVRLPQLGRERQIMIGPYTYNHIKNYGVFPKPGDTVLGVGAPVPQPCFELTCTSLFACSCQPTSFPSPALYMGKAPGSPQPTGSAAENPWVPPF